MINATPAPEPPRPAGLWPVRLGPVKALHTGIETLTRHRPQGA